MWFPVYCVSPLTELECHVLWRESNRLDACSSLLSWLNKGKIQLWTALLCGRGCRGVVIGALTLLLLCNSKCISSGLHTYLHYQLSRGIMLVLKCARKRCIGESEERGKVPILKESSLMVALHLIRKAVPRQVVTWSEGSFLHKLGNS